jgi:hypothetical protein
MEVDVSLEWYLYNKPSCGWEMVIGKPEDGIHGKTRLWRLGKR